MIVTVRVGDTVYQGWDVEALRAAGIAEDVIAAGVSAAKWAGIRTDRDLRLTASDWTQLPDSPLTAEQKASAAAYRQALRDLTEQPDPDVLTWPEPPAFLK